MPKNNVTDPITDQEMAFAHMVLSGTMTDRRAAEAVGLDPNSAAYTKAKPRVRAYMQEHQAAVQQRMVEQEAAELRRHQISRDQILTRLWEIANLSPETTRGSITGQVKALNMIMAIEGLLPDRRAASGQKQPAAPSPAPLKIHPDEWQREQQGETLDPQSFPAPAAQEAYPAPEPSRDPRRAEVAEVAPPAPDPTVASPMFVSPADIRLPYSINSTQQVGANEL